ncbi:MAG TPA: ABC-type transport auxiliary lipoprotein family protein [Lacunisphaera sp.]
MALSAQLSALSLLLAACNILPEPSADPVRNFTLSGPVATTLDGATVRPVQLAGHLRGRAMAVRIAANEVIYDDTARWAEPLDEAITQLLRAHVGGAGAGRVIAVQIQRCELVRNEGNSVQLAATYAITAPNGTVQHGTFTASPRTWDGKDYGVLVGEIRDAIGELGDALAVAVR